jgi:hypothetical protein
MRRVLPVTAPDDLADPRPCVRAFLQELGTAMWEAANTPQMKYTIPVRVPIGLLKGFVHPADTDDQAVINAAIRLRVHEYVEAEQRNQEAS